MTGHDTPRELSQENTRQHLGYEKWESNTVINWSRIFFLNKRDTYQHTLSHLQHNLFYRCNRTILSCLNSLHLNGSCGREVHVPGINHQENTHLCLQVWRKKGYRLHCTHNYSKILPNSKRKTAGVLFECRWICTIPWPSRRQDSFVAFRKETLTAVLKSISTLWYHEKRPIHTLTCNSISGVSCMTCTIERSIGVGTVGVCMAVVFCSTFLDVYISERVTFGWCISNTLLD